MHHKQATRGRAERKEVIDDVHSGKKASRNTRSAPIEEEMLREHRRSEVGDSDRDDLCGYRYIL
jgi:hypothetical protein